MPPTPEADRPIFPCDILWNQFKAAIVETGHSYRRIGHYWAAETDEDPTVLSQRISAWVKAQPKSIRDFVSLMDALGYEVLIKRKGEK
jgi:hypothetical protein